MLSAINSVVNSVVGQTAFILWYIEHYTAVIILLHSYGHICLIAPGVRVYGRRENKAEQPAVRACVSKFDREWWSMWVYARARRSCKGSNFFPLSAIVSSLPLLVDAPTLWSVCPSPPVQCSLLSAARLINIKVERSTHRLCFISISLPIHTHTLAPLWANLTEFMITL